MCASDSNIRRGRATWHWYAAALALVDGYYWLWEWFHYVWPFNQPKTSSVAWHLHCAFCTNVSLAAVAVAVLILPVPRRFDGSASRWRKSLIVLPLAIFFLIHVESWYMHRKSAWIFIEDIGSTTVRADRMLFGGQNPYAAHFDSFSEGLMPGHAFDGYKYLPVMMGVYAPFVAAEKDWFTPILDGNLLLGVVAAGVLGVCARRWISPDAGLMAGLLFFIPRMMSDEQVQLGVNDVVPMILLMLALYWIDRRLVSGLLVGLAISSKLLPGLFWIPICLTPKNRRWYLVGIACGLMPCLPFVIWNGGAFVRNTIVFLYLRTPDYTSPLYLAGRGWIAAAKLPGVLLGGWITWRTWGGEVAALRRCGLAIALTIAVLLGSPTVHPNYFLWWFVPFCVVMTAWVFNPGVYEWMNRAGGKTISLD